MNALKLTLVIGAVASVSPRVFADEAVLKRVPQLQQTAAKAIRGELGCGVGTLKLVTSRGEVAARCGLDPIQVFGNPVKTADLIALLKSRAESNRTGKPGPMSGQVSDLGYVCLYALSLSKDPEAIPVIAQLLTDKDDTIQGWAVIALYKLGADEKLRNEVRKIRFPKEAVERAASNGQKPPPWVETAK
jgi:hypothetical protein